MSAKVRLILILFVAKVFDFDFLLLLMCLILIYLFDLEFLSLPRCLICILIVANVFDFATRTTQGIPALTACLPTDYSVSWNQVTVECSDYFEHLRIQAPLIKFSATLRTIFSVSLCLNNQSHTCPQQKQKKTEESSNKKAKP